jgi:hypothetical protein
MVGQRPDAFQAINLAPADHGRLRSGDYPHPVDAAGIYAVGQIPHAIGANQRAAKLKRTPH